MKIHSSVNLITNSSSTTFTTADGSSVLTIKTFIDQVLKVAGSDKECDDLFDIDLVVDDEDAVDEWGEKCVTNALTIKDKEGNPLTLGQIYESWTTMA